MTYTCIINDKCSKNDADFLYSCKLYLISAEYICDILHTFNLKINMMFDLH